MGYLRINVLTLILFAICTITFCPTSEAATSFVDIFEKKLSVYDKIPQETFDKQARHYERFPFADDALAYELKLPNVWNENKSFGYNLSTDIYTDIGRYIGPIKFNKARSYIIVKAMEIGLQASAKTMAASYFMNEGYTVQGAKAHSRNYIETLHVQVENGETYIVRSLFIINGGKLVVMSYFLPQSSWNEERDLQYRVIHSFALLNKVQGKIDNVKSYEFFDLASFQYPKNWQLDLGEEQNFDHMGVMLLNYEGELDMSDTLVVNGRITIEMFAKHAYPNFDDLLAQQIDIMISQGIVVKNKRENFEKVTFPQLFENQTAYVYNVLDSYSPNQKSELWIVAAQAYGYSYIITVVSPTKDEDFMMWGSNNEALQFIVDSLTPSNEW